jgi:hypothetical protein
MKTMVLLLGRCQKIEFCYLFQQKPANTKALLVLIAHLISLERNLVYTGYYSSLLCCYKMARFVLEV